MINNENPFNNVGIDPQILRSVDADRIPRVLQLWQRAVAQGLHPDTGASKRSSDLLVGINEAIDQINGQPELINTWLHSAGKKSSTTSDLIQPEETYSPSPLIDRLLSVADTEQNVWSPATYLVSNPNRQESLSIVHFDGKDTTIQKAISVGYSMNKGHKQSVYESVEYASECKPIVDLLFAHDEFAVDTSIQSSRTGILVVRNDGTGLLHGRLNNFKIEVSLEHDEIEEEFSPGIYNLHAEPIEALIRDSGFNPDRITGPSLNIVNLSGEAVGKPKKIHERIVGFVLSNTVKQIKESISDLHGTAPTTQFELSSGLRSPETGILVFHDDLSKWMLEQGLYFSLPKSTINRPNRSEQYQLALGSGDTVSVLGKIAACVS